MNDQELQTLRGLTAEEARRRVEARGLSFRVIVRDGVSLPRTADYRLDRVEVALDQGRVVAAAIG